MNPTAPSPDATKDRLAEQFGLLSQGLAASGGSGGLSALLIGLVNLIIQALRSITWNVPAAATPGETEASRSIATPKQEPISVRPRPQTAARAIRPARTNRSRTS